MQITRKKLRKIILAEIFERGAEFYQFQRDIKKEDYWDPPDYGMHKYNFKTNDNLEYTVLIYAPKFHFADGGEEYQGHWDVSFSAKGAEGSDQSYGHTGNAFGLTGKNDIKVLNTIIQVVKDFVSNVRTTLPDPLSTIINFKSEAIQERGVPGGDTRRGRIYQYMLKKQGIKSTLSFDKMGSVILEFTI